MSHAHKALRTRPRPRIRPRGVIWSRKCGQVLTVCCPEGTNDGSQAIYCLETRPIENPSRRARSDPYPGLINRPNGGTPIGPNHTVPYGTVPVFAPIPGNKLPGYFHNVPTGQRHLTPVHTFGATSECGSIARSPNGFASEFSSTLRVSRPPAIQRASGEPTKFHR